MVAPQGLDALPRISGPLAFGSLVSFVPRITLVTIADTIKAPCSRHHVMCVCATQAMLRLVLLLRLHRIICRKSFAVLLVAGLCAHDFSVCVPHPGLSLCAIPAPSLYAQGMTTAIRSYVFASLAIRALIAYMILLLAYLPGW